MFGFLPVSPHLAHQKHWGPQIISDPLRREGAPVWIRLLAPKPLSDSERLPHEKDSTKISCQPFISKDSPLYVGSLTLPLRPAGATGLPCHSHR